MSSKETKDFPKNAIVYSTLAIVGFGLLYLFNPPTPIALFLLLGETLAITGLAQSIGTAVDDFSDKRANEILAKRFGNDKKK